MKRAQTNIPISIDYYIENMRLMTQYAMGKDVKVMLVQQPIIFNSDKKLVSDEIKIYYHTKLSFFSLSKEELNSLNEIPTHQINKQYYWDFEYYVKGYETQKSRLKELADELNVNYHDLHQDIKKYSETPIYTSVVHYTLHGAEAIALSLSDKVKMILQ